MHFPNTRLGYNDQRPFPQNFRNDRRTQSVWHSGDTMLDISLLSLLANRTVLLSLRDPLFLPPVVPRLVSQTTKRVPLLNYIYIPIHRHSYIRTHKILLAHWTYSLFVPANRALPNGAPRANYLKESFNQDRAILVTFTFNTWKTLRISRDQTIPK